MSDQIEQHYRDNYMSLVKRFKNRAGSVENAEDVVMESFARAYRYIDSFDASKKDFGAWFNTILNNSLRTFKKDERNYGMNMEFDEIKEGGTVMPTVSKASRREIRRMINQTANEVNKQVLRLYYILDYTPKDIQIVMDIPRNSIMSVIRRFNEKVKVRYASTSS